MKVVVLGQDPYHGPNQAHGQYMLFNHYTPPPNKLLGVYRNYPVPPSVHISSKHSSLTEKPILMKLYTIAVYDMRICMIEYDSGMNYNKRVVQDGE